MALVEKSALVPFSDRQMFGLVKDVDRYPDFLPWCKAAQAISDDGERICGRIEVARVGIHQAFTTCNAYQAPRHMSIQLVEGPFKSLHGSWEFIPLREDACKVVLQLEFEFAGHLINAAFGKVFHQIANTLVESFCNRAREVYGG
jgi:ribosome-associated toxin RatA of RatAB toxin-antitoxin module